MDSIHFARAMGSERDASVRTPAVQHLSTARARHGRLRARDALRRVVDRFHRSTVLDPMIERLAPVAELAQVDVVDLAPFSAGAEVVSLDPGTTLVVEGERPREAVFILEGSVAIAAKGAKVAEVGAGEAIGAGAVLSDARSITTAIALTALHVVVLDARTLRSIALMFEGFAERFAGPSEPIEASTPPALPVRPRPGPAAGPPALAA